MATKKVKSKKKSRAEEEVTTAEISMDDNAAAKDDGKARKKKSKKEKSKKRIRQEVGEKESDDDGGEAAAVNESESSLPKSASVTSESPLTKEQRRAAREAKKSAKSKLKKDFLSKIPTVDADGIPYNKIQIRRMMRRVKHGLDPIATEEEEREIRAREKREKREEEALYAEEQRDANDDTENEKDGDTPDEVDNEKDDEPATISVNEEVDDASNTNSVKEKTYHNPPPTKKAKRSKPVPPDYICQACKNQPPGSTEPHWIYDCILKKTQRGCNTVAKKLRGLHDPSSQKVFVNGLPFDCDEGYVKRFFQESMLEKSDDDGTNKVDLVHVKLLKFEDSKRCKGQAFLTFDSDEGAKLAIRLMNGSIWKDIEEPGTAAKSGKKKKKDAGSSEGAKKELRLKVTKVLNRFVTKNKKGGK